MREEIIKEHLTNIINNDITFPSTPKHFKNAIELREVFNISALDTVDILEAEYKKRDEWNKEFKFPIRYGRRLPSYLLEYTLDPSEQSLKWFKGVLIREEVPPIGQAKEPIGYDWMSAAQFSKITPSISSKVAVKKFRELYRDKDRLYENFKCHVIKLGKKRKALVDALYLNPKFAEQIKRDLYKDLNIRPSNEYYTSVEVAKVIKKSPNDILNKLKELHEERLNYLKENKISIQDDDYHVFKGKRSNSTKPGIYLKNNKNSLIWFKEQMSEKPVIQTIKKNEQQLQQYIV